MSSAQSYYLKDKDNIITYALSCVIPLIAEAVDIDDFAIPVHHIMSDVSPMESQQGREWG